MKNFNIRDNRSYSIFVGFSVITIFLFGIPNKSKALALTSTSFFYIDTGNSDSNIPIDFYKDPLKDSKDRLNLKDPENVNKEIEFDKESNQYIIKKSVGDKFYSEPNYIGFDDFQKMQSKQSTKDYWKQKSDGNSLVNGKNVIPKLYVPSQVFDRIFGGSSVNIRPQGSAELIFQGNIQRNDNPNNTARQRKQTNFNFDQRIQLNVIGNIGDKLKVTTNYNTEATFDFENQFKLEYTGYEDEIIKKIELGNVSLPLNSSLISGAQSLFGLKTQLQFGRLTVTSILTQQRSDQKEIQISNGSQKNEFNFSADNYEANKHYFLAHYFRDNYDRALGSLPAIISGVQITKVEVWITNKNNITTDTRDILAFMDLGENNPYNKNDINSYGNNLLPSTSTNPSNNLLNLLPAGARNSNDNAIETFFKSYGADNFIKLINARKLSDKEFNFHPQLGYISLNSSLNSDEVLAVAYRYIYNGKEYTVGEFSNERPETSPPTLLFVKLLKNVSLKVNLPIWDLMMKNIYSLNAFQVNKENFRLDVLYLDEKTNVNINYFQEGEKVKLRPIISLLRLDRLNQQSEKKADGMFDYLEGLTVNSQSGKIIFPFVEPFGKGIDSAFGPNDQMLASIYSFHELYDSTKFRAQQLPQKNKYTIKGSYQSSSSSEFNLNAINVPQGSVKVTSGTTVLTEGSDYTVDYNLGRVKIINQGVLQSGSPIKIKLESATLFGIQAKSLFGSRFDYKVNDNLNLGGTILTLSEKPITQKVNIGDEAIKNSMYGLDFNYRQDSRFLTQIVDKIPFIDTKETSTITVSGEYAYLDPGHATALNEPGSKSGLTYIDDFEGTRSTIDLRNDRAWYQASTPVRFAESQNLNLSNGFNRALLSTYAIEPLFYSTNLASTPEHIRKDKNQLSRPYFRQIIETEVFPNLQQPFATNLNTLNLTFYPTKRGQYNFNTNDIDQNGNLLNPKKSWAGVMRGIESSDFEALNVEYIEFWLMDPFIENKNSTGGDLYFNLGNITEDYLKDGRKAIENGLPTNKDQSKLDTTVWGKVPKTPPIVNSFDNDPNTRYIQDVGLDGLTDDEEREFYKESYLDPLLQKFGPNSQVYKDANEDPSADNYRYFLGTGLDGQQVDIVERYKLFNKLQGNSPTTDQSLQQTGFALPSAQTPSPNSEDVNRDNTMNVLDEYFEYKVHLSPQVLQEMDAENFIADKVTSTTQLANKKSTQTTWYQFKIPLSRFASKVGEIQDFRAIRFIRMYLTNFEDTSFLRFARLQLVRSEWRKLEVGLTPGEFNTPSEDETKFDISTVNIQENSNRLPINYKLPPGVEQQQSVSSIRGNILLNEQSLALTFCNLEDGKQKAAYKNANLDVRSYKRLELFTHLEGPDLKNKEVSMFIRIGTDYLNNYYEYEIPLKVTAPGDNNASSIWPAENKMDIPFEILQNAKQKRNQDPIKNPITKPYIEQNGDNKITVVGSPDLSNIRSIIIGVRNPKQSVTNGFDDGLTKCGQIWVNELRLKDFDEKGGWATTGRMNAKLADFANVTVSGSKSTVGFGSIEKKVSERNRDNQINYDASSTVELGKFLPENSGIKLPMYVSYSHSEIRPQFAPGNNDLLLEKVLDNLDVEKKATLEKISIDQTTRKSINFTNIKKIKTGKKSTKSKIYDIENLNASASYAEEFKSSYTVEKRTTINYRASLGYNFSNQPKNYNPLTRTFSNDKLRILRDFNYYLLPSGMDFRIDADRLFNETQLRNIENPNNPLLRPTPTFNKNFGITRVYGLKYDLTRGLKLDFSASNMSRVEEPEGRIDNKPKTDTLRNNFLEGGINTAYSQTINVNYAVPINKLPYLDWVSMNARYSARYDWLSALPSLPAFGHTISNSQSKTINPQLNLTSLYNKSKFLKDLSNPKSKKNADNNNILNRLKLNTQIKAPTADSTKKKEKSENDESIAGSIAKGFGRILLGVKNIGGTYTETNSIQLPGYLKNSKILGSDYSDMNDIAPGGPFILGSQKDIRYQFASNGWLTTDKDFNLRYSQQHKVDLNLRSTIEPFQEFRIELSANRSYSANTQSLFKSVDGTKDGFMQFDTLITGTFNMSYLSIKSSFETVDPLSKKTSTIETLEQNRVIISGRLAAANSLSSGYDSSGVYRDGYGSKSQQVLLASFLAAYSGADPNTISLNPFPTIPIPNWRISYTGLNKIPIIAKVLNNLTINHSYRSTYSVNSYNRPNIYRSDGSERYSASSRNFIPEFEIAQVSISEQYAPLIGFDITLKSNISVNFEYKTSRNINLSFAANRIEQSNAKEFTFGTGYRTNNLKLPFEIAGVSTLTNDINFKLDISIRDQETSIHRIDQSSEFSGGTRTFTLRPTIDYVVNQKLNIQIFYDRMVNTPKIPISFRTAATKFGVSIRFTIG